MFSMERFRASVLMMTFLLVSGCAAMGESNKEAEKRGYTYKTVRSTPAPRDKTYKIVKVPLPTKPLPACPDSKPSGSNAPETACDSK